MSDSQSTTDHNILYEIGVANGYLELKATGLIFVVDQAD